MLALYFDGVTNMRPDFRLSRASFHALMGAIGRDQDHGWGTIIEALVFLFWLASGTSYRVVSRAFDMPWTSVHRAVHRTSGKIMALFCTIIHHPTAEELVVIGAGFAHLAGMPVFSRVAGAIDGCHIRVKPPSQDAACYINRKLSIRYSFRPFVTIRQNT